MVPSCLSHPHKKIDLRAISILCIAIASDNIVLQPCFCTLLIFLIQRECKLYLYNIFVLLIMFQFCVLHKSATELELKWTKPEARDIYHTAYTLSFLCGCLQTGTYIYFLQHQKKKISKKIPPPRNVASIYSVYLLCVIIVFVNCNFFKHWMYQCLPV